jgi:hypothetical protein
MIVAMAFSSVILKAREESWFHDSAVLQRHPVSRFPAGALAKWA